MLSDEGPMQCAVVCGQRYRDAPRAIDWLCDVLGFRRRAVYEGPIGRIAHAELVLGRSIIMLGSFQDNERQRLMIQPDSVGGAETRSAYLVVPDADAVLARVRAAGGEVVIDIADQPFGGRAFTCRDPEGHVWHVGSYDPWAAPTP